jgi:hypothetical protein
MKREFLSALSVCAAAFVFTGCATSHHSTAWDYKIISGGLGNDAMHPLQAQLEQAVAAGWEVVSGGGDGSGGLVILRKPK